MVRFALVTAWILVLLGGLSGCKAPSQRPDPISEGVKIPDLAAPPQDRPPPPQFVATVLLDVHILDVPADNVEKLKPVWQMLSAAPIRLMSYNAFSDNGFRLLYGKTAMWDKIQELLVEAEAQAVTTVSLTVADYDKTDQPIAEIPMPRPIHFVGTDLSQQTANVGAGILTLRLVAEPIPQARGVRKIIGYPTYTLPGTIPQLQAQSLSREFRFEAAAFACQMGPGDLLVLGPEKYTGERATLGGLFFNKPNETLFFNPNKSTPAQRRAAVRVYILVCTQVRGG
jgi:hypothetical protein